MTRRDRVTAVAIGAVLGFVLGVTSVGSGALIGLALILVFHLTPHRVVGTDVFHAAILLWVAGLAHFAAGNVDFAADGQHPGRLDPRRVDRHRADDARARRRPAPRARLRAARRGAGHLLKAGVEIPAWAIVGVPLALGAFAWLWQTRRRRPRDEFEVAHEGDYGEPRAPVPPAPTPVGSGAGQT